MKELEYWYLREDLLPQKIECIATMGKFVNPKFIKELKEAGNLFPTKEQATIASEKVREFLCSINNPWCL